MLQKIDSIIDDIYSSDKTTPKLACYTSYKTVKGYKGYDEIIINKDGEVRALHYIQLNHVNSNNIEKVHFADNATCKKFLNKMTKVLHSVK